jgi:hypothetical protein
MTFPTLVCIISRQPITICVFLGASVTPTCKQPPNISSHLAPRHASSSHIPPRTKVTATSTYRHVTLSSLAMSYSTRPLSPLQPPQTPPPMPPMTLSSTMILFWCLALLLLQVGLPPCHPWSLHPTQVMTSHPPPTLRHRMDRLLRHQVGMVMCPCLGPAWSIYHGSTSAALPQAVWSGGCPGRPFYRRCRHRHHRRCRPRHHRRCRHRHRRHCLLRSHRHRHYHHVPPAP